MSVEIAIDSGRPRPVLVWAGAGLVLYVFLGMASIFLVATIEDPIAGAFGLRAEAGTQGWGVVLGAHPVAWGVLAAAASAWLGRRLVPGATFGVGGVTLLGLGLILAAATTYLLHEFVRERYSTFDSEYAGFAIFAAPAVVAIALAGWAALAAPGNGWRILIALQMAAVTALSLAIGPSLPGLSDGIRASSIPLAGLLVIDAIYALGSLGLVAIVRVRRAG